MAVDAVSDEMVSARTMLAEVDDIERREDEIFVAFNSFVVMDETSSVVVLIVCPVNEPRVAVDVNRLVVDKKCVNTFV